jgi:predicted dehydrogenase
VTRPLRIGLLGAARITRWRWWSRLARRVIASSRSLRETGLEPRSSPPRMGWRRSRSPTPTCSPTRRSTDLLFMEGFHCVLHPVTRRLHELLASGELGELRHAEARLAIPAPVDGDPRWSLPLAGGALMDLGCYSLHALRMLAPWAGGAPRLESARAGIRAGAPEVDEWLDAELPFPGAATGPAQCHMASADLMMSIRLVGSRGEASAPCFVLPVLDDRVVVRVDGRERVERLGSRSSHVYQLEAFAAALRDGAAPGLDAEDALATMTLIDDCYRAAGLSPRPRVAQ